MRDNSTAQKRRRFRSLATKFSCFTAWLVLWVTTVQSCIHWAQGPYFRKEDFLVGLTLLASAALIASVTSRLIVRPLVLLNNAMVSVREGNLEPIRLSRTGDEIEQLGDSFNEMIAALAATKRQVADHQEHLEEKIRIRTAALVESTRRAEAGTRAKSEFLANMSHELRTPMNGILGMLDIVLDGRLSLTQREDLETAKDSALSLLSLVNDILDLSKIEAGKMNLEKIRFEPRELADGCCSVLLPRARQKGLAFRCQIAPEVPDFLLGDPLRLQQVLMNLVGNAIKYTHAGSVELRVGCRPAAAPGVVELRLDVLDTGIGIPADKLDSIFEKFTQADGSITREYGGTGLGLAISKSLVEMHGGRLWVDSEVGLGSAFHVSLPLQLAPAPAPEAEGPAAKPPADAASSSPGHILIVEDNPTNQKVVVGLLGKRGYRTSVANDGRQALEALERTAFDLILMDVQMPVLDGLEATRLIRRDARWKALPVVGLTAHAMVGDRQRCLDAGMDDYLPKPIRPAALIETIQRCMPART